MRLFSIVSVLVFLSKCDAFGGFRPLSNCIANAQLRIRSSNNPSSILFSALDDDRESPNLGINIGSQLQPLSPEDVEQLRQEATEKINEAFAGRIEELENIKKDIKKDFEKSKVELRLESDRRAKDETEKLMRKIDKISTDFLDKNEALRSGTKLAARADKSMAGKGLEIGSWGQISGANVLTSSSSRMTVGILGSVDSATKATNSQSDETGKEANFENRILIICDSNQVCYSMIS